MRAHPRYPQTTDKGWPSHPQPRCRARVGGRPDILNWGLQCSQAWARSWAHPSPRRESRSEGDVLVARTPPRPYRQNPKVLPANRYGRRRPTPPRPAPAGPRALCRRPLRVLRSAAVPARRSDDFSSSPNRPEVPSSRRRRSRKHAAPPRGAELQEAKEPNSSNGAELFEPPRGDELQKRRSRTHRTAPRCRASKTKEPSSSNRPEVMSIRSKGVDSSNRPEMMSFRSEGAEPFEPPRGGELHKRRSRTLRTAPR